MLSYGLEEVYRWYHIFTQPHIFSAKLTQGLTAATSFMHVWPDTSLAQPPNLSLISAHESIHYCTELEIQRSWLSMWQLLTAEGLEAWGNWGGGRVEALLLIPWDIGLSGVTDAQKILKELSPSCPQQWIIALQRILVLPFPPSMLPLPGSSPLFPGITAQNELSHANLWMRLWFPGDCENGHREGVGMGEWQWEVSRLRNRSLTPHKYGSSL